MDDNLKWTGKNAKRKITVAKTLLYFYLYEKLCSFEHILMYIKSTFVKLILNKIQFLYLTSSNLTSRNVSPKKM